MRILLTNDDGIYAPGLIAMERELRRLGEVDVVAPATEQSGVGHAITYLTPLVVKEVYVDGDQRWGWMVEGSPADCVRIAIAELCPQRPDLVVSGINGGLNVGINVLYSGTVAAAIEGAFYGITSVAVSLEFDEHARFDKAARLARRVIEQVLGQKRPGPQLYNLNIPTVATSGAAEVRIVPMDTVHYGERFEKRFDPWGRAYYWATGLPAPPLGQRETDLTAIRQGFVTLTPLDYNMTKHAALEEMQSWRVRLDHADETTDAEEGPAMRRPMVRIAREKQPAAD
ncbi:MAG: 5'/3'-nucleotidase SurE [Thermoguttaceae bacterium]|nr:5'/3'-nucleotidase SurE [Thermoguttaceae bacterium]